MDVPSYILDKKNWRKKISNFFTFHRGDPYDFSRKNPSKIFLKNHKGPPYEKWKNLKFFFSIFFVQDVAWDIQKCMLELFFKNLYTILNALYRAVTNFKTPAPFSFCVKLVCRELDKAHFYQVYDENLQQIYTLEEFYDCRESTHPLRMIQVFQRGSSIHSNSILLVRAWPFTWRPKKAPGP